MSVVDQPVANIGDEFKIRYSLNCTDKGYIDVPAKVVNIVKDLKNTLVYILLEDKDLTGYMVDEKIVRGNENLLRMINYAA